MSLCSVCKAIPPDLFIHPPGVGNTYLPKVKKDPQPMREITYLHHDIFTLETSALVSPKCPLCHILLRYTDRMRLHQRCSIEWLKAAGPLRLRSCIPQNIEVSWAMILYDFHHPGDYRDRLETSVFASNFQEYDLSQITPRTFIQRRVSSEIIHGAPSGILDDFPINPWSVIGVTLSLPGRQVPWSTERCGSTRVINQIETWMDNCLKNHSSCNRHVYTRHVADLKVGWPNRKLGEAELDEYGAPLQIEWENRAKRNENVQDNLNNSHTEEPDDYYPTRVLDVGPQDGSGVLSLCLGKDCLPGRGYLALSHRWPQNSSNTLLTTSSNLQHHLSAIATSSLPKAFQDAVIITRKLGFRYIWVDSLCIIQDSPDDWKHEANCMADVYSRAICTIAASASEDSTGGFLGERTFSGLHPYALEFSNVHKPDQSFSAIITPPSAENYDDSMSKSTLVNRAWTLQERALSTRILHFTPEQVLWECRSHSASEDDPQGLKILSNLKSLDNSSGNWLCVQPVTWNITWNVGRTNFMDRFTSDATKFWQTNAQLWQDLVVEFSKRQITFSKDWFPAISGLANQFHRVMQGRYLAGIWEYDVMNGLAWRKDYELEASRLESLGDSVRNYKELNTSSLTMVAPSWSWVCKGPVEYKERCDSFERIAQVTDVRTDLDNPDHPFGGFERCVLSLSGRLRTVVREKVVLKEELQSQVPYRQPLYFTFVDESSGSEIEFREGLCSHQQSQYGIETRRRLLNIYWDDQSSLCQKIKSCVENSEIFFFELYRGWSWKRYSWERNLCSNCSPDHQNYIVTALVLLPGSDGGFQRVGVAFLDQNTDDFSRFSGYLQEDFFADCDIKNIKLV